MNGREFCSLAGSEPFAGLSFGRGVATWTAVYQEPTTRESPSATSGAFIPSRSEVQLTRESSVSAELIDWMGIWQDKLVYGDNLSRIRECVQPGSVDLVYLDPPFNSNQNYNVIFSDENGARAESQRIAFRDTVAPAEPGDLPRCARRLGRREATAAG